MKRLGILFTRLMTGLWLVISLGTVPLWVRSYFAADYLDIPLGADRYFEIGWAKGTCFAGTRETPLPAPIFNSYPPINIAQIAAGNPQYHMIGNLGYEYASEAHFAFMPFWLVGAVTGALSARWIYYRFKRAKRGPQRGFEVKTEQASRGENQKGS